RPDRPLASGQVSPREAALLAAALFLGGVALAWLAGLAPQPPAVGSGVIALVLVPAILLYDAWLKRTPLGPLGMGACRFLNVLLGLSGAGKPLTGAGIHLAFAVGLYIVGVTWLARTEAR